MFLPGRQHQMVAFLWVWPLSLIRALLSWVLCALQGKLVGWRQLMGQLEQFPCIFLFTLCWPLAPLGFQAFKDRDTSCQHRIPSSY